MVQAKDIDDRKMLSYIEAKHRAKGLRVFAWDLEQDWPDVPPKVLKAKSTALIKRGLMDGCACGCRGDFELTDKGCEYLHPEGGPDE